MKDYLIELTKYEFCTLISSLDYTRDNYALYRAEEFKKEVESLRLELYNQLYEKYLK